MKLRYSEAFYSVQGEGKFVGVPSVFLRTFGCNFRCMNFGVDTKKDRWQQHKEGQRYNAEVKALIDAGVHETTEKFEDLPIIHTGCDTYASIHPNPKHFNKLAEVDEVVEHPLVRHPEGKWTMNNGQDIPFDHDRWRAFVSVAKTLHRTIRTSTHEGFEKCYI